MGDLLYAQQFREIQFLKYVGETTEYRKIRRTERGDGAVHIRNERRNVGPSVTAAVRRSANAFGVQIA